MLGRFLGRPPPVPPPATSSPLDPEAAAAKAQSEKRAAASQNATTANIVSARTSAATTLGTAAAIAALGKATNNIPVIGAAVAGLVMLVASAVRTNANLNLQKDLIKRVERDLIFIYYQVKVIQRSIKLSPPPELTLDTTGIENAINSLQIALVNTVGTKEQKATNAASTEKSGLKATAARYFGKFRRFAWAQAGRDLAAEMDIVKAELEILRNEMNRLFIMFSTHRPLMAPLELLDKSTDADDKTLLKNYTEITDGKKEAIDDSFTEFSIYLKKQPEQDQQAALKAASGAVVVQEGPAPAPANQSTPRPLDLPKAAAAAGGALWPPKYYRGLSTRRKGQRRREITRRAKMSHKNPAAYRPFATDRGTKRRPSSYTSRFHAKYPGVTGLPAVSKATGVPMSVLEKVYDRGLAAWRTGHRPGASQHAWGMARVYSFVLHGKTWRTADADLARRNSSQ